MNKAQYQAYLRTDHWRRFRYEYSRIYKQECYLCGAQSGLELHHVTYERLGKELYTDVAYLCSDCHTLVHHTSAEGNRARQWLDPVKLPAPKRKERDAVWGMQSSNKSAEGILPYAKGLRRREPRNKKRQKAKRAIENRVQSPKN
jgi:hypothetical protein